jgi:hypothetical protein
MSTDNTKPRGLKTIVRAELALRGIKVWDKKAPQGVPNKKASKKLEARRRAWDIDSKGKVAHQRTRPGSYNLKRG